MPDYRSNTSATWNGGVIKTRSRRGAAAGLNMAIERLRGHSVERAPVDLGDLRGSATVEQADESQRIPTAVLIFDENHAAVQHEDETLNHTPGAAGEPAGEARYVAKNYEDSTRRDEYRDLIGKGISDAFDRP